ncbi:MAG: hypothetical protein AAFU71_09470 [Cyanobacteria bacterium J06632_22]
MFTTSNRPAQAAVGDSFDVGTAADARVYGGLRFADIWEDTVVRYDGIDFTNT